LPLAAGCAAAAALFLGVWTMLSDLALRLVDPRLREADTRERHEPASPETALPEPQPW
jgi:hypothetical protein